jgi:uncharacterized protein
MTQAWIRFHDGLEDFLQRNLRGSPVAYEIDNRPSIKHAIEALGAPHTEVRLIFVNGQPVGFGHIIQPGDVVDVHPYPPRAEHPEPDPRFLLDNHLGRLAAYLRMLSFDSLYGNDYQDDFLAEVAQRENRILLTRDRRLLMRNSIQRGYCVRSLNPKEQFTEVLHRYNLFDQAQPFRRCLRCNGLLDPVEKETISPRLEPLTRQYFHEFRICRDCGKIYWRGSHFERMQRLIERVMDLG